MTINRKTNGYERYVSAELTARLEQFEKAVEDVFGCAVEKIEEFFYGEKLVMTTVVLVDKHYADFNISANRISFNGHTCDSAEYEAFGALTLNDECFKGGIIH